MRSSALLLFPCLASLTPDFAFADQPPLAIASLVRESVPGAGSHDAPRVVRSDLQLDAQPAPLGYRSQSVEVGYRWWVSRGQADLGLGLGTIGLGLRPAGNLPGLGDDGASTLLASRTVMTVGMRYRTSPGSALYADASGLRGYRFENGEAVVGKVGVEFKSAQSRFNIAYGGLGLRLDGDTRMTVRVKRGGLAVYMRSTF